MLDTVGLVTLCRDPTGNMVKEIEDHAQELTYIFPYSIVIVSKDTSSSTTGILEERKFKVIHQSEAGVGAARRDALHLISTEGFRHILLCDLDRSLQWIKTYPDEMEDVKDEISNHNFLILGRTKRAMATHPEPQRYTEALTNQVFKAVVGLDFDLNTAARGISRRASDELLKHSRVPGFETDVEWPLIIKYLTEMELSYRETEGLEYETEMKFDDLEMPLIMKHIEKDSKEWKKRTTIALNMTNTISDFKREHASFFSVKNDE